MSHRRRRTLVAATSVIALLMTAGMSSGARGEPPRRATTDLDLQRLETLFEKSFAGLDVSSALPADDPAQIGPGSEGQAGPFAALPAGGLAAYGSGTVQHTAAVLADEEAPVDSDIGLSDAAHSTGALPSWRDEISRVTFPALQAGASHGRGSALEIRRPRQDKDDEPIVEIEPAVAKAPPSARPVIRRPIPADVPPILEGGLLRAEAGARALDGGCVIGSDLAIGLGSADRTDLADVKGDPQSRAPLLSLSSDKPPRAVSQSLSRTRLVPLETQLGRFGALAEIRQTIAPVTLFEGDDEREITIEVAGEWVLQAMADGATGSVALGVDKARDRLPLLRFKFPGQDFTFLEDEADLRRLANKGGIILDLDNGLEVVIGEPPRGLRDKAGTKPVATGTQAAGAVDILRVQLTRQPKTPLLRVGHMEGAVAVPAGGIACPGIGVAKRTEPARVEPGKRFTWLLAISNPNDCELSDLRVVDAAETAPGLGYKVALTTPPARKEGNAIVFDKLPPLGPGEKQTLRLEVDVAEDAQPGRFANRATATGVCGTARLTGAAGGQTEVEPAGSLPVVGQAGVNEPEVPGRTASAQPTASGGGAVEVRPAPTPGPEATSLGAPAPISQRRPRPAATVNDALALTGGLVGLFLGTWLVGAGVLLRRFRRR